MAARMMPKTTIAAVEAISNGLAEPVDDLKRVFHGVLLGRLKRSDFDLFLWADDGASWQVRPVK
jgi:hypothetical protein